MKRIALVLVILLILLEGSARLFLSRGVLSGNIRHIKTIPKISEEIARSNGTKILFIGNSLINNGIDLTSFRNEYLLNEYADLKLGKVNPDGTELWDWYYILKNDFVKVDHLPDVVVIGFAWELLRDERPANPSRLAAFFCRLTDLPELISQRMNNYNDVGEFLAASFSKVFALRGTIRNRFLLMIVPNFAESVAKTNKSLKEKETAVVDKTVREQTYERLNDLLWMLRENGVKVILVAMPIAGEYKIDSKLQKVAEKAGASLVDNRKVPNLSKIHFLDEEHLNNIGAKIYSKYLARFLRDYLSQQHVNATNRPT